MGSSRLQGLLQQLTEIEAFDLDAAFSKSVLTGPELISIEPTIRHLKELMLVFQDKAVEALVDEEIQPLWQTARRVQLLMRKITVVRSHGELATEVNESDQIEQVSQSDQFVESIGELL
jgi:hypothetical protein